MKHIKSLRQDENMLLRGDAVRKKRSAHTFRGIIEHINWSKYQPQRAGVIPYIVNDHKILFAFGLDTKFRAYGFWRRDILQKRQNSCGGCFT